MCGIFVLIGDVFKIDVIIEPMQFQYKDFRYIEYVMGLSFFDGYTLYKKCKDRFENSFENDQTNKIWDLFLLEIQSGCTQTFEDYYNTKLGKEKKKYNKIEEENIINKYKNIEVVKRRF